MPIYQCAAPAGMLTHEMKAQIAAAITDATRRSDRGSEGLRARLFQRTTSRCRLQRR